MIGMLNKHFCLQWKSHAQQMCTRTLWSLTSTIWKIPVREQYVMSLSFRLWYFNNERWFSLSASHQEVLFIELPVGSHIHTDWTEQTSIHPSDTAFTFCHHYRGMAPQHYGYFPALSTFRRETKRGRERESEKLSVAYVRADRGSDRCSGPEEAS